MLVSVCCDCQRASSRQKRSGTACAQGMAIAKGQRPRPAIVCQEHEHYVLGVSTVGGNVKGDEDGHVDGRSAVIAAALGERM